jgi:glycerol-3-phosphate dehydrogenase
MLKIGGGAHWSSEPASQDRFVADLARRTGLDRTQCRLLADRYGSHASQIAEAIRAATDNAPLATLPAYNRAEIRYLIESERTTRLTDLLLRRTQIALMGLCSEGVLDELADLMADALSWPRNRRDKEIALATDLLQKRHGVLGLQNASAPGQRIGEMQE